MEVVHGKVAWIYEHAQIVIAPNRDPIVLPVGVSAVAGAKIDDELTLERETPRSPWACQGRAVAQTADEAGWVPSTAPANGDGEPPSVDGEGDKQPGGQDSDPGEVRELFPIFPPDAPNPLDGPRPSETEETV